MKWYNFDKYTPEDDSLCIVKLDSGSYHILKYIVRGKEKFFFDPHHWIQYSCNRVEVWTYMEGPEK